MATRNTRREKGLGDYDLWPGQLPRHLLDKLDALVHNWDVHHFMDSSSWDRESVIEVLITQAHARDVVDKAKPADHQ